MNVHLLDDLLAAQEGLCARWQLVAGGWPDGLIERRARRFRTPFDGVYLEGRAPVTPRQRLLAATLTAPRTVLSHASCGGYYEIRRDPGLFVTVTRPGSGGPKRIGDLLVCRSTLLAGNIRDHAGIPCTSPERVQIDLAPHLSAVESAKVMRESIRRTLTTTVRLDEALRRHPGARGTKALGALVARYERLPLARCRSDAEAYGLEALDAAGLPVPRVNERFAGEEADFCWPERMLIIEIDGPSFHRFKEQDARKTLRWRAAGFEVRRIASGDVFDHPERLVALYRLGL